MGLVAGFSIPQNHHPSLYFPFQLGEGSPDQREDEIEETHKLLPYDLVVMSTDGLWDNLFEDQMAELAAL